MPEPADSQAAQWLLAEFDDTQLYDLINPDIEDESGVQVHVQPMFMLKSVMESGHAMRVTVPDYADLGRWWL